MKVEGVFIVAVDNVGNVEDNKTQGELEGQETITLSLAKTNVQKKLLTIINQVFKMRV